MRYQMAGAWGVVTASGISAALKKLDADVQMTDINVQSCASVSSSTKQQWQVWKTDYQAFSEANKDLSYFTLGLAAIGDQTVAYEAELARWQDQFRAEGCSITSPLVTRGEASGPDTATILKAAIGVGLVGITAYLVVSFMPTIKAALKK